jgi:hypothetical protein
MRENQVWAGGYHAWSTGLRERIGALKAEFARATTDEKRQELAARLESLERERREAKQHGDKWLF